MRRFRQNVGGSIDTPDFFRGNLRQVNAGNRPAGRQNLTDFYSARLSNISTLNQNLIELIKTYLAIPTVQYQNRARETVYIGNLYDLREYSRTTLRTAFGIDGKAPTEFDVYMPTFIVYDFLIIRGLTSANLDNREVYLRLAGMIRKVLPSMDSNNFGKWDSYYKDFKSGKYSGGITQWRARKALETRYDPVDPIFDFDKEPKVKIPHVSASDVATSNALWVTDVLPPNQGALNNGKVNIIRGGSLRRAVRSSRRRI